MSPAGHRSITCPHSYFRHITVFFSVLFSLSPAGHHFMWWHLQNDVRQSAVSIPLSGYLDAVQACLVFIFIALWTHGGRTCINRKKYSVASLIFVHKNIIGNDIKRSKSAYKGMEMKEFEIFFTYKKIARKGPNTPKSDFREPKMPPRGARHKTCTKKCAPIKQTEMAKHGRLVNIPKWSKGVQKGPKSST